MAGGLVVQELEVLGQLIKSLGDGERTDSGYDGEINIYWDAVNLVVRMQVYSATKGEWEAFDPTGYPHASRHSVARGDTITVENLATEGAAGTAPVSDGAGAVTMENVATQAELDAITAASLSAAPDDAGYLVTVADESLSGEVPVGLNPGGQLGGSWGNPTVDNTHAEGAHSTMIEAHRSNATAHHSNADDHPQQSDHASGHVDSTDLINGDHLDVTYTPTNYMPDTTPAEAADLDDLAAHLYGIDIAIGAVGVTIKSRQSGSISISDTTSGTATITAIVVANCQLANTGVQSVTAQAYETASKLILTNTTTVTATRGNIGGGDSHSVGYEVFEWE